MAFGREIEDYTPPPEIFEVRPSPARIMRPLERRKITRKHNPTPELRMAVERAYGLGLNQMQIAHLLGVTVTTLKAHYTDELAAGPAILQSELANRLVNMALDPDSKQSLEAAKFVLSRRFGWTEKTSIEMTGRDGGALQIETAPTTIDARRLTPEQRDNLRELLLIAAQPTEDAEFEEVEDEAEGE